MKSTLKKNLTVGLRGLEDKSVGKAKMIATKKVLIEGKKDLFVVEVTIKKVLVKNNHTTIKAFAKIKKHERR